MLVLSRRINQVIIINDEKTGETLKVKINDIRKDTVSLCFDAPKRFRIIREEIYKQPERKK